MPSLLLIELAALSQAPGFLGHSFLIHPKLVLEACGLVHRRSPWSGSRKASECLSTWQKAALREASSTAPPALLGEPISVTFLFGLLDLNYGHLGE